MLMHHYRGMKSHLGCTSAPTNHLQYTLNIINKNKKKIQKEMGRLGQTYLLRESITRQAYFILPNKKSNKVRNIITSSVRIQYDGDHSWLIDMYKHYPLKKICDTIS